MNLFITNKKFQNLVNLSHGSSFVLFLIVIDKNFKINFLCYLIPFCLNFIIGFEENIDYLIISIEFLIMNFIILSVYFYLIKKNRHFQEVIIDLNKNFDSIDDCFNNLKDGIIILKKDGKIKYNKNFIQMNENIENEKFLFDLKKNPLNCRKNDISQRYSKSNYTSHEVNDCMNKEDFYKTDLFQIFIKINIFNKINTFNKNLTSNVINLIQTFNEKIFNLKISLDDEKRKNFNLQNIQKLENEKYGVEKNTISILSKLNESNNHLIYQYGFLKEINKNSNLNIIENDYSKINKKDDNQKIKTFGNSNINSLIQFWEKELNKNKSLIYKGNIDEKINGFKNDQDILQKLNECYDDFIIDLRFLLKENNKFDYILIGERIIEDKSFIKKEDSNAEEDDTNKKNKISGYSVSINYLRENTEKEKNKNVCIQKIFIRFNNINDSLEILFQNLEILKTKEIEREPEKNYSKNKNLLDNIFPKILFKICNEIKNPILNIIELTREIKQKYNYEDKTNQINIKKIDYAKNIKYLAKSINFVIKEFDILIDVIRSYDNPIEIIKTIRHKKIFGEGIFDLAKEIEKMKKIFQFKINLTKKNIIIISSFENIPKKIKLEGSIFLNCIYNILSNSLKFSTNGIINIKMNFNCIKKKLCIEISDQGIGIKKDNLNRIGNVFYKTENHNNDYGLGIGLFTIKMIVEAFNGNLQIVSEYGQGTYISIELPLIEDITKSHNRIRNIEKTYILPINKFESEKYEEENNSNQKSYKKRDKNNLTENISCYKIYPDKKYFSSDILLLKNNQKKKEKLLSKNKLKMKSATFTEYKTKNYRKDMTNNKTQLSKFYNQIGKTSKNFTYEDLDKIKLSSINNIYSNYDESNFDIKINNIFISKSSDRENSNFSSGDNKSTVRNSNLQNIYAIPESNDSNDDSNIFENNTRLSQKENLKNSKYKYNYDINRLNIIKNPDLNTKNNYGKISANINNCQLDNNLIEFQSGIFYNEVSNTNRNESVNQLPLCEIDNPLIKGKIYNSFSSRNKYLNKEKTNSITRRSDYRLDINYKDFNLKSDDRSAIYSENNKSDESNNVIKIHLFDDTNELNTLLNNIDLRILVIDDEELIRRSHINLIKRYCKKEELNIIIEEACDGADCLYKIYLGLLKGIKYDLIFIDEAMNFINGGFTAKIIKSLIKKSILENMKIIMITSYEQKIIMNSKSDEGIDYIYDKPLDLNILRNIFSECFDY